MTNYVFLLILALMLLLVIIIIINNIKQKYYLKGYHQAEFDITASMLDKATWFSGCSIITYNVLYLFAVKYRKYGYVDANKFREDILKLTHEKRITDLKKEELQQFI